MSESFVSCVNGGISEPNDAAISLSTFNTAALFLLRSGPCFVSSEDSSLSMLDFAALFLVRSGSCFVSSEESSSFSLFFFLPITFNKHSNERGDRQHIHCEPMTYDHKHQHSTMTYTWLRCVVHMEMNIQCT